MVSFSSSLPSMDMKKLTFSDHLMSSPRRKVFSPFGLGVLLSFIVLTVVLFNISSKGPIFNPVFQGLHSFGSYSNTTSLLSWPFSGGLKDSGNNSTLSGFNDTVTVQNTKGSNESLGFVSSDGKNETFDSSHFVGNDSEVKIGERNGSDYVKSPILADNNGTRAVLGTTPIEDSVNSMKNGSVSEKEVYNSENSTAKYEDGKGGNSSYDGVNGDLKSNGTNGPASNKKSFKDCDIFNGKWVKDEAKPYYPPGSCPFIDRDFDCHLNGRPDNQYVKWRWQPNDCDIPRLNATDFLERLRGKKLVFVGDSLNRNMWESLVCALRHGVQDKSRVYEISGKHEFKKKGFYAFRFEDYDCSVDFVSSPFLVKESYFNGKNGSFETLRLDLMDGTTSMYHDADVIIFNTGHWWTHEKTSRGEDYYQEGNYIHPRLKVLEAYKRALFTWAKWVDRNIDTNKTEVIYRGYSVTHFRGGPWNSGGQCNNETEPIFNDNHLAKYPSKMKVLEYVLKDMKTPVTYLNISRLTDYRKDGHPSIYRPDYLAKQEVHAQDCSHWCLPGVPDTWNELLYVSLLKNGRGSWKE